MRTSTWTDSSSTPMFAATDRRVLSSQMASALARMSPEQGVSPAPPAAGCRPERMVTAGNSVGVTAQCLGSARSLAALCAAVTTSAEAGSDRYRSLSGACTLLRSMVYAMRPILPPSGTRSLLECVREARPAQVRRLHDDHRHDHQHSPQDLYEREPVPQHEHRQEDGDHRLPRAQERRSGRADAREPSQE